jgi:anti-sigma regulatory factor (Ser/Thr protein kinase)
MRRDFPRNLDSLSPLYEFAEEIFETNDISPGVRFPVHLAMDATSSKEVTVTLVDDGGVEFDVTEKRQVNIDAPLEERTPGGLGIHLIQNLADRLEYTYKDGRGKVIFTKGSGNEDV